MTSSPAAAQQLSDLTRLRRVRDRIDREYARPRFSELVGVPPSAYRRLEAGATAGCRRVWPSR